MNVTLLFEDKTQTTYCVHSKINKQDLGWNFFMDDIV